MRFKKIVFSISFFIFWGCHFDSGKSELCFIGDSITHQWDTESFFSGYATKKYAVSGAKLRDVDEWETKDCADQTIVFLIGTNDIGFLSPDKKNIQDSLLNFAHTYAQKARSFFANPLLVISILPRNYQNYDQIASNKMIQMQNLLIKQQLDSLKVDYKFIDVFKYFLNKDYMINEDLFRDGLHPNPEGYELLSNIVKDYL